MNITLDQVAGRSEGARGVRRGLRRQGEAVVDAYAKAFPDKKPVEIWSLVSSNRQSVVDAGRRQGRSRRRRSSSAWFGWQPPLFDGRIGAFHCVDICFWFHNTDLM